jgi:two-component system response regulator HydG
MGHNILCPMNIIFKFMDSMQKYKILVIDDDEGHRSGMVAILQDEEYEVAECDNAEKALELLRTSNYDLVITDYKMRKIDGMQLLKMINDFKPLQKMIMVTGYGSIEHAVQAIHNGALDYITKPVDPKKLKAVLRQVLEISTLERSKNLQLLNVPKRYIYFGEILGKSKNIKQTINKINEITNIDVPVLISGESGTGKELVACAIHNASHRKEESFVAVNTGAIPKDLILSELFGHEKGSFTGAVEQKKGKFEEANKGTLFLDEISNMSHDVQIALLRVLENKTIDRVGGKGSIKIDVRVVAATNEDLKSCIDKGIFREDLYYRLNVYSIELDPLRKRKEDIPLLIDHFIRCFNEEYHLNIQGISQEALALLQSYSWPGNVRELRNIILSSMIASKGIISKKHLPLNILKNTVYNEEIRFQAGTPLPEIERDSIIKTIKKVRGNKLKAAELLGISRRSLYNKIEEYHIRDVELKD